VQVRREVDVLLCVLSASSQLRIREHQLCRCAQEVDGKTGSFRLLAGFGSPSGLELGDLHKVKLAIETCGPGDAGEVLLLGIRKV
jgi:hypothetical protein